MQEFMQAKGVRAAQLAISKQGLILFPRAYRWAEPGYPVKEPATRFLLANCSKIFLEAAVQCLYTDGKLKPGTQVYPLLGFSGPLDPRADTITMQQLLDHTRGRYDRSPRLRFHLTFITSAIPVKLGLTHPVA